MNFRTIPGTKIRISEVGLDLRGSLPPTRRSSGSPPAILQRASQAGIGLLAVGAQEVLATTLFSERPPPEAPMRSMSILLRWSREEERGGPRASFESDKDALEAAARRCREYVGRNGHVLVVLDWAGRDSPPDESAMIVLRDETRDRGCDAWGVRYSRPLRSTADWEPVLSSGGNLVEIPYNLLHRQSGEVLASVAEMPRLGFIAGDVFSGGLLDGTDLGLSREAAIRSGRPQDLAELNARYAPVLRLGFLTENGRRTLPQAALRFALSRSWVSAALVPFPVGPALEHVARLESTPEISEAELQELSRIS